MTCIRSVLARGNGAVVVHRELERALPGYALREIDPYLASLPPVYRAATRGWLAPADLLHLAPDYGPPPGAHGARCVYTFHNFYIDAAWGAQASPAQRLYYRHVMAPALRRAVAGADRLVVVSRFLAGLVATLAPRAPVEVIHNGIDTARFRPAADAGTERPLRVLFVGNPSRRKGFDLLGRIAARLPPGTELAFTAGLRGDHRRAAGLVPLGRVPYERMHELYRQADVLLFPTWREGFGLCVAEAMACGLPVVSTRCSAIPELVDEGRGGYLLAPDDADGMAAALVRLLSSAALRADMGAWNRDKAVREFDVRRMTGAYADLFSALGR